MVNTLVRKGQAKGERTVYSLHQIQLMFMPNILFKGPKQSNVCLEK